MQLNRHGMFSLTLIRLMLGINSILITKPIITSKTPIRKRANRPVKILYTGNLLIGRINSLKVLIDVLNKINYIDTYFELDIYTQTNLEQDYIAALSSEWCKFRGNIPQEQVLQKQNEADILLFLEDITGPYRKAARLSFSTKITDYLSAGKCIFAIGDMDIAPMEYFKKENAAITASSALEIFDALTNIKDNPNIISEMQENSYNCGIRNHCKEDIDDRINNSIKSLISVKGNL